MTPRRIRPAFLTAIVVTVAASSAVAQPAKAPPGQSEFVQGRAKFLAKDFSAALPLFEAAYKASASPNAGLFFGLCQIEMNRLPEAFDTLTTVAHDAKEKSASDASYARTFDAATKELNGLTPRIGRVSIAADEGADVTVNGKPVSRERLQTPVAVMPGKVVVVATTAAGPKKVEVNVAASEVQQVTLRADDGPRAPEAPPPVADVPKPPPPSSGPTPMRIGGIAIAGVGVVGIGMFAAFGLMANSDYDSLKQSCPGHCTDPKYDGDISRGRNLDGIANAGLAMGIVGLASGATLFVLGGKSQNQTVSVGPGYVGYRSSF